MAYVPERSGTLADERELPSMRSGFPRDLMRTSAERISREAVSTTGDHRFYNEISGTNVLVPNLNRGRPRL
jgi:hypothetical protein